MYLNHSTFQVGIGLWLIRVWNHGSYNWAVCIHDSMEIEISTFIFKALCTIGKPIMTNGTFILRRTISQF